MSAKHPDPELLIAFGQGDPFATKLAALRSHLADCEECAALVSQAEDSQKFAKDKPASLGGQRRLIPEEAYSTILDNVFGKVVKDQDEMERQRTIAPTLLEELASLSIKQQKFLIRNSPRFHIWALAELLVKESRVHWTSDPVHAEEMARVALEIADRLKFSGFREQLLSDLKAEAWSCVGNCLRIQSDLIQAQAAFQKAKAYLAEGTHDPMEYARLCDLESSLQRARRQFAEANRLLTEAISCYRNAGELHLEGRALINQAKLFHDSGQVERSVPLIERASELVDPRREPRLVLLLKWNLISHLTDLDRLNEAQRLLPEVRELARRVGSRQDRLRILWVEGVLRQRLHQEGLAEEALKQVREGFISEQVAYDVALVSLDLAILYLEKGRTDEARSLALETLPIFGSRNIAREALAAWSIFREAAERDALTLGLVQEVASRIRQSQFRPAGSGELA